MTEPALTARSDAWIWLLVVAATCSVVALAVLQGRHPQGAGASQVRKAPEMVLPLLGGGSAPLPQDRVTMVDFWATWCAPCRASMPRVQKVWQEYHGAGLEIYSVDTDDPGPDRDPQVREFLVQNGLTFPVVLDDGTAERAFSVANLPTLLLLDRQGKVVWSHIGALNAEGDVELRVAVDRALRR